MLDAGCGNGSQSFAYTEFGLEVVALDLSTGLEKGYAFRQNYEAGKPDKGHFVKADLQNPPLAPASFDIIHSAGVLHHTPNTDGIPETWACNESRRGFGVCGKIPTKKKKIILLQRKQTQGIF